HDGVTGTDGNRVVRRRDAESCTGTGTGGSGRVASGISCVVSTVARRRSRYRAAARTEVYVIVGERTGRGASISEAASITETASVSSTAGSEAVRNGTTGTTDSSIGDGVGIRPSCCAGVLALVLDEVDLRLAGRERAGIGLGIGLGLAGLVDQHVDDGLLLGLAGGGRPRTGVGTSGRGLDEDDLVVLAGRDGQRVGTGCCLRLLGRHVVVEVLLDNRGGIADLGASGGTAAGAATGKTTGTGKAGTATGKATGTGTGTGTSRSETIASAKAQAGTTSAGCAGCTSTCGKSCLETGVVLSAGTTDTDVSTRSSASGTETSTRSKSSTSTERAGTCGCSTNRVLEHRRCVLHIDGLLTDVVAAGTGLRSLAQLQSDVGRGDGQAGDENLGKRNGHTSSGNWTDAFGVFEHLMRVAHAGKTKQAKSKKQAKEQWFWSTLKTDLPLGSCCQDGVAQSVYPPKMATQAEPIINHHVIK
uniref:Uncharacterized protein n=1 Tax=Anopheles farauti TaxID=69004 RepID=A0A182QQI0_9DIPT